MMCYNSGNRSFEKEKECPGSEPLPVFPCFPHTNIKQEIEYDKTKYHTDINARNKTTRANGIMTNLQ